MQAWGRGESLVKRLSSFQAEMVQGKPDTIPESTGWLPPHESCERPAVLPPKTPGLAPRWARPRVSQENQRGLRNTGFEHTWMSENLQAAGEEENGDVG